MKFSASIKKANQNVSTIFTSFTSHTNQYMQANARTHTSTCTNPHAHTHTCTRNHTVQTIATSFPKSTNSEYAAQLKNGLRTGRYAHLSTLRVFSFGSRSSIKHQTPSFCDTPESKHQSRSNIAHQSVTTTHASYRAFSVCKLALVEIFCAQ